jgi:hypothetical protein
MRLATAVSTIDGASSRQHGWGFRAEVALPLCNAAAGAWRSATQRQRGAQQLAACAICAVSGGAVYS